MTTAKKRETGVWVLTVEPHWGSRGKRTEVEYYYRTRPSDEKIAEIVGGSHYSIVRKQCSRAYQTSSYH